MPLPPSPAIVYAAKTGAVSLKMQVIPGHFLFKILQQLPDAQRLSTKPHHGPQVPAQWPVVIWLQGYQVPSFSSHTDVLTGPSGQAGFSSRPWHSVLSPKVLKSFQLSTCASLSLVSVLSLAQCFGLWMPSRTTLRKIWPLPHSVPLNPTTLPRHACLPAVLHLCWLSLFTRI